MFVEVDPILFRKIVLVPCPGSLEKGLELSQSHVAAHVRGLVYDSRWQGLPRLVRRKLDSVDSTRMNSDHKSTVLECLKNWEETDIRPREDTTLEVGFLARIIGSLSALESVEVLETDGCETKLDLPQYYAQRRREIYEKFPEAVSEDATYRMSVDNEKQHAPSIMAALCVGLGSSRTIKSLNLNCLDWATFLSGDTDEPSPLMVRMHRQLLRPLSKLSLGQSKNSTSFEEPGWYYDDLRTLLSSANSLEWLDLSPGNRTATHLSYHFGFSEPEQWFFSGLHFMTRNDSLERSSSSPLIQGCAFSHVLP